MNNVFLDCVNFFKKNKEYKKLFDCFRKKILTNNSIEGTISIKTPTEEERKAFQAILSSKNFKGKNINFTVEEFKKGLEKTKFEIKDIDLKELTNQYYGEVVLSKEEQKRLLNEEIELFFSKLVSKLKESNLQEEYITKYIEIVKNNYFDKGKLKEQEEELQKLYYCGMAIYDRITADTPIKIAFLGEKITKDPHYFDKGIKGSLLVKLLKLFNNIEVDEDLTETEKAQEIFYQSKIEVNTISNYVTAYGIRLFTKDGEIKAYSEFIKDNLLYNIPLEHLKDVIKVQAKSKNIFIVENEMVFVRLYEHFRGKKDVALICTSGQLRLASLVLIDLLLKEDYQIHYSGDIDPEGIGILNRVIQKSGNKIIPWRVNLETYLKYEKNENPISETSLKKLTSIKDTRFKDLILAMEDIKKACYQESFINELINDIKFFL
jgi:uncharacterized protein (TIGR02679 family)